MPESTWACQPESLAPLMAEYAALLCRYVADPHANDRARAQALGAELLQKSCSPDTILSLHAAALRQCPDDTLHEGMVRASQLLHDATAAFIDEYKRQSKQHELEAASYRSYVQVLEALNQDIMRLNQELIAEHQELQNAHEDQVRLNQQKADLLNLVGHEIRTPLTALLGYGEFLEEGTYGPLTPEQEEILHRMVQSGRDLMNLINNLLDMSRLEAGKMPLIREAASIPEMVDHVLAQLQPLASRKGLKLSAAELGADLPPVWVDPTRIIQVLVNLLGNAIKFTDRGGEITLGASVKGPMVELWVRDTGIGITPEAQAQLFQRFTQVENVRRYGGTGLGLSICKELITMHGGDITVESEPGRGATFKISLPIWNELDHPAP